MAIISTSYKYYILKAEILTVKAGTDKQNWNSLKQTENQGCKQLLHGNVIGIISTSYKYYIPQAEILTVKVGTHKQNWNSLKQTEN